MVPQYFKYLQKLFFKVIKRYHSMNCDPFYESAHPDFTSKFIDVITLHHKWLLYAKSFKIILRTLKFATSHVCALMTATHAPEDIKFAGY